MEESVAVTRLNLEHARALQTDQVTLQEEDAQNSCPEHKTSQSDQEA